MTASQLAEDINELAAFLGPRDVPALTPEAIEWRLGARQADAMVLFGGSILAGGDVLAEAMRAGVARTYVIAGGAGHTTEALRSRVRELCPDVAFADDAPEADVFAAYLAQRHGLTADLLERASTNCGNNVTYLLDLLAEKGVACESLIVSQDATMQRRMEAGVRRKAPACAWSTSPRMPRAWRRGLAWASQLQMLPLTTCGSLTLRWECGTFRAT